MAERLQFDGVLVIGAGLAGLTAALAAAPRRVLVLSAGALGEDCASAWAQGGVAAALAEDDTPALHAADTMAAGVGLCDAEAVAILTREGPGAVRALAALGAPFDRRADGSFVQSLEAAHRRARVARVGGDGAGLAIMDAVFAAVKAAPNVEVRAHARAVGLITDTGGRVRGAIVDVGGRRIEITAAATILATGGLGGLYAVTTNPAAARGEGLALAAAAGAEIFDPEFVQFHPTAIEIGADPAPLATEALRGEGACLINAAGERFMPRYHPDADLAPRDIVARAIETERRTGGAVFLDGRGAIGEAFDTHFPSVFAACLKAGIDARIQPIPVAPAAHYHMGGIGTDLRGATTIDGLFAVGECASVGVHGANRLASNSLLEAAVFGRRAGEAAGDAQTPQTRLLSADAAPEIAGADLTELRRRMSDHAGVVRSASGLGDLLGWIDDRQRRGGAGGALIAARLVAQAALDRRESRGGHFRSDYPTTAQVATHTRLQPSPGARARDRAA